MNNLAQKNEFDLIDQPEPAETFGIRSRMKKVGTAVVAGATTVAANVHAAVDVAGVNTAIGTAETSAHSVGTTVIGVVAGLAVVSIIIGLVRKL
jgi:hypothetical protein